MPDGFVARPEEFAKLKAALLDPDTKEAVAITAALRGAGGFGKTVLAQALAHDDDIQDAFHDGVLWVTLGEKPSLIEKLADLLKTLTGEPQGFTEISAAANKLREVLADRKCLLVIDDVWSESHLRPFLEGAPLTARLVTTRIPELPREAAVRIVVDKMTAGEALALLKRGLPTPGRDEDAALSKLATDGLRNWPILIGIVNGILSRYSSGDHTEPLAAAIETVASKLDADGVLGFDAATETDRNMSVARTIEVGLDVLDELDATRRKGGVAYPAGYHRARYRELALYPEDTEIPITTIGRLWGARGVLRAAEQEVAPFDPHATDDELRRQTESDAKRREAIAREARELVERFYGLALLEALNRATRTVRIHDVMRKYLTEQQAPEVLKGLHHQFVEAYDAASGPDIEDAEERRYFYTWFPTHLHEAGEREVLDGLLLDPQWMQRKLDALEGPMPLVADYERLVRDHQALQKLIGQTLRLTSGILTRDRRQLLPQLMGRLMAAKIPFASNFLATARCHVSSPAFLTQRPSLTPPGAETVRIEGCGEVTALVVLPDGRLASGSGSGAIRLWDAAGGVETARLEGHSNSVEALAVLLDGRLASASGDATIRLWDTDRCGETARLCGHGDWIRALAVLPDGRLASGSDDATIRLWDTLKAVELARLESHAGWVNALVVLPDGRLASGHDDGTIRLWDTDDRAETACLEGHGDRVTVLALLPDGRLASGSGDDTIRLWDVANGDETASMKCHSLGVMAMAVLPDGRLATSSDKIQLWDTASGIETARLDGHNDMVMALAVLPDGRLASGSTERTIRLWDTASGAATTQIEGHGSGVRTLALLPSGSLASGYDDGTILLWDTVTGGETARLEGRGHWVNALTVMPDGRIAAAFNDNTIRLWNTTSGAEYDWLASDKRIWALVVLPNGRLATGSVDDDIRLWDAANGAEIACLKSRGGWYTALAVLPDGRLASGCSDNTIQMWDTTSGKETARLEGHVGWINALVTLSDGRLASGSYDGSIRLWDIVTGAETAQLKGHRSWVTALAVLPDGRLASGSLDKTIRLWDADSGAETARLEVDANVDCLAVLLDGRLVAGDGLGRLHWLEIVR